MRILYLALSYIPSRRASSVQVMKMCSALARRGHEVVLVAKRGEALDVDDHAYYCVDRNFEVDKVMRPKRRGGGVVYALGMAARVATRRRWADLVYCRDQVGTMIASQAGIPLVWEAHGVPTTRWRRAAIAHAVSRPQTRGVVSISEALRDDLLAHRIVTPAQRMVVSRDACDPPVNVVESRPADRRRVVGYVGGLYQGRGIELILALAQRLPHVTFRLVGGSERDVAQWSAQQPPNVEFLGFRRQAELPGLYATMDVVLMPYARSGILSETRGVDTSKWTSPMKMFEYMSSGAAIVSSDLPVLREVLVEGEHALYAPADDVARWQAAIERLIGDEALRVRLASTARQALIDHYTWDARAAQVMVGLGLESR